MDVALERQPHYPFPSMSFKIGPIFPIHNGLRTLPANFPISQLPATGSLLSNFAAAHGSSTNLELMVNMDSGLNGAKSRIMNTEKDPMVEERFQVLAEAVDSPSTAEVLESLRDVSLVLYSLNSYGCTPL